MHRQPTIDSTDTRRRVQRATSTTTTMKKTMARAVGVGVVVGTLLVLASAVAAPPPAVAAFAFPASVARSSLRSPALLAAQSSSTPAPSIIRVEAWGGDDDDNRSSPLTYRSLITRSTGSVPPSSNDDIVVLVHPVGIGMASWFYDRLMNEYSSTTTMDDADVVSMLAVNLRGCGQVDASAVDRSKAERSLLDPKSQQQQFPSFEQWVTDCAKFIDTVGLLASQQPQQQELASALSSLSSSLPSIRINPGEWLPSIDLLGRSMNSNNNKRGGGVHLVVQGGLAPVGIELASRCPHTVRSLTLCSPPEELKVVPPQEIQSNLRWLSSPLGNAAIGSLLENPSAIRIFSNLFLFGPSKCDDEWVERAAHEAGPLVRPAVQFFNAGGCCQVDTSNLQEPPLSQPVLILQGSHDPRSSNRVETYQSISSAGVQFQTIQGAKNVLPWEAPAETAAALQRFFRGMAAA